MNLTIEAFMTPMPHSIGPDQTLTAAHEMMRNHDIRHLPVLQAGRLVGILSQRDLHLVETLEDVDPNDVTVEEAMTLDPYTVGPRAHLRTVATAMAEHKHGSAVVMRDGRVVGIFTTVDALRALASLIAEP
ncbi:MAG TPA: CBS domain-containing protein [Polyangia bacterium]|nr:CBS domain-containing protein [Polyangia bacterium]